MLPTRHKPDRRAILQAHPLFRTLGADLVARLAACAHGRTHASPAFHKDVHGRDAHLAQAIAKTKDARSGS